MREGGICLTVTAAHGKWTTTVNPTQKWLLILRDLSLLAVGVIGLLHQEFTGQANPWLLGVYTAILGVPGAANVIAILKNTDTGNGDGSRSASVPQEHSEESQQ